MKIYSPEKIFVILSIPLILLTCNTFAENDIIEELHAESAILVSQSQCNKAIEVCDQILEIDPNNVKALINRSAVLIEIGQNEKAIYDTNRILAIDPNNIKALKNKGVAFIELGYAYDAITTFEKAIEIYPNDQILKDKRNYLFGIIDLLEIPTQEKYDLDVQAELRTQNDELITVIEGVMAEYLPSNVTDEYLNSVQIIKIVEKNGKNYEMRQVTHNMNEPEHKTYGKLHLYYMCDEIDGCVNIFGSRIPGMVIDGGDYLSIQWTIYRLVE